jgi:hypothetical protein
MRNLAVTARVALVSSIVLLGAGALLWIGWTAVEPRSDSAVRGLAKDPRSPEYDPIELVRALDADPWALVIAEPRVTEFAERREGLLADKVRRLLDSRRLPVALDGVECFASSCVIRVSSAEPGNVVAYAVSAVLEAAPLFDSVTGRSPAERDGTRQIAFAVLFRPDSRAHEDYERRIEEPRFSLGHF